MYAYYQRRVAIPARLSKAESSRFRMTPKVIILVL